MSHPLRTPALIAAASVIALSAVPPALAQTPAPPETNTPAQAPATPPATPPTASAPPVAAPETPATPTAPGVTATPGSPDAAPAAEPAPAAPPEPPPVLPTSGDGASITTILTNVCEPLVRGKVKVDQLAKTNGLKLDRKSQLYIVPLAPKTPYQIGLEDPGVNKNVCTLRIQYAQGGDSEKQIRDSLNIWRFLHKPKMFLHRNEQAASITGQQAVTITWDNRDNIAEDGEMFGLVFRQEKKPDGTSLNKAFDQGVVEFTIRSAASVGITPKPAT